MSKWLDPYDFKGEDELVVTVTLAEYRELVKLKALHDGESDAKYINDLKLEIKRLGGTVPMRLDDLGGESAALEGEVE